jgi:hypothetical protein
MDVSIHHPDCFSIAAEDLTGKRARRGSRGEIQMKRKKSENLDWRGFRIQLVQDRHWGCKHKQRGSRGRIRRRVASAHRTVISRPMALRVAIAFISIEIFDLTVVQRAIHGIAASGQFGGRKRFGQRRQTCQQLGGEGENRQ